VKPYRALTAAVAAALLCVLLAAPALALAAAGTATTGKDPYGENTALNLPSDGGSSAHANVGGGGGGLARTFIGLAVVVAVIYGLYWILRQVKAGREEKSLGKGLESTASVALGPNRSLHLVRAGNELVLVGVAENAVTPIRTYTEDEARAAGLLADDDDDLDDDLGATAASAAGQGKGLRGMTIGDALERIRKATVRA
jgi:flagellar protein FliO/FliZ